MVNSYYHLTRKSNRLRNHDYSKPGKYFITIITNGRENIFGDIIDGIMNINKFGQIIKNEWHRTEKLKKI